jgi:hypothetical protein
MITGLQIEQMFKEAFLESKERGGNLKIRRLLPLSATLRGILHL